MKVAKYLFLLLCWPAFLHAQSQTAGQLKTGIESKFGITVEWNHARPDTWQKVTCRPISDSLLTHYLVLMSLALEKYPADYFKRIGLKYINISTNLKFDGVNRSAVPDNYNNVLFLAAAAPGLAYHDYYLIHCFHHELNHFVEFHLWDSYRFAWNKWTPLFDSSNKKGGEYAYSNADSWYAFTPSLPGFSNKYSTLGQEEDRSELIAFFLTDENREHERVVQKTKTDSIYFRKCELLFNFYRDTMRFSVLGKIWQDEKN